MRKKLVWDADNHLTSISGPGITTENYVYDADGNRVKKSVGGTTTYYPFRHYEVSVTSGVSTITKYYFFGGQRVAMKVGSVLTYLHGDHLGSTVLETNTSNTVTADEKYFAYGKQRDSGPVTTDHKFTGQKLDGSGLMYYGARFYDPQTGLFVSPDTIVADPGRAFAYNRAMYVYGNPLLYSDPSGHQTQCMAMQTGEPMSSTVLVLGCQAVDLASRYGPTIVQLASQWADKVPAMADWMFSADQASHSGASNSANSGNSSIGDPNNFDPNKNKELVDSIKKVIDKNPINSGNCSKCASDTFKILTKAGYKAEIVQFQLTKDSPFGFIETIDGVQVASNRFGTLAFHQFVRVGDRVFDALTGPQGMLWTEYMKKWDPYMLKWIVQTVVQSSE